jgi:ribosomal protein S18 acetylase RimI-like enzyme
MDGGIVLVPFEAWHHAQAHALWARTDGVGLGPADALAAIGAFLQRNPGLSFAAFDGDRLVGTLLVGHDGRRGLLHHLAVCDSRRRRGIGAALLRAGLAALAREGIAKCHLLVFADNAAGRAFWHGVGAEHRDTLAVYSIATAPDAPASVC